MAQARARGERRVRLAFTADQRQQWRQAVEQELAGKDANVVHIPKKNGKSLRLFPDV